MLYVGGLDSIGLGLMRLCVMVKTFQSLFPPSSKKEVKKSKLSVNLKKEELVWPLNVYVVCVIWLFFSNIVKEAQIAL